MTHVSKSALPYQTAYEYGRALQSSSQSCLASSIIW